MDFRHEMFMYNDRLMLAAHNSPVMKIGERGQAVRIVQHALTEMCKEQPKAYAKYDSPDGVFTSETVKAVKSFQKELGLTRNGRVGEETLYWLDTCMADYEVVFNGLPPIPDMGSDTNAILEASTQVVVDTLLNSPLQSTDFHLRTFLFSTGTPQDVYVHGRSFRRIGEAVLDGEIAVAFDADTSKPRPAAWYDFKNDVIVLGRPLKDTANDRCMVIHEAAHAICDRLGNPLDAMFSEAIGFVAESLYMLKTAGRAKSVGSGVADAVYAKAYKIAQDIAGGKQPPENDVQDLGKLIKQDPDYGQYAYGTVQYNGRTKR